MRVAAVLVFLGLAVSAKAEAPKSSPIPPARPASEILAVSTMSPARSPRPYLRPRDLVTRVMAQRDRRRRGGGICGSGDIQGEEVGAVPGRIAGCGMQDGVRLRSVSGVTLSQEALVTCGTARALNAWVARDLRKSVGRMGGGVAGLKVAAHYVCRTRNHQPGAPVSEHGKGKAIDISEIRLVNGDTINVLRDWGNGRKGQVLAQARSAACGTFGTVLGPGSDGFHRDHFHLDTARWGTGPVCR